MSKLGSMYEIKIKSTFSAAHSLRNYKGSCENLHGHNWKVEVVVLTNKLNKAGIGIDFRILKRIVNKVLTPLDHNYLNKLPYFKKANPSAENIAKYIYKKVEKYFKNKVSISKVTVWESDSASLTYYEEK